MNYYYDWENGFSTDPSFVLRMPYTITLDGIEIPNVFRCCDGAVGFVECFVLHDQPGAGLPQAFRKQVVCSGMSRMFGMGRVVVRRK